MHLKWQLIWSACSRPQHPLHGSTDPLQWQAPCSSQVSLSCSPLPQISTCIALGLQKVYAGTACAARWLPNGCYSHFHCFLTHCHYLPLLASIQARLQCTIAHVTGKSGMQDRLCTQYCFETLQLNMLHYSAFSVGLGHTALVASAVYT